VTRVCVPAGLDLADGVYDVSNGELDLERWDELREAAGVTIECDRHPGQWWPTAGKDIAAREVRSWRCPSCGWNFRKRVGSTGGTPQF